MDKKTKIQFIIFPIVVFMAIFVSSKLFPNFSPSTSPSQASTEIILSNAKEEAQKNENLIIQEKKKVPERNWKIYDPELHSEAVLLYSLDDDVSLFRSNVTKEWPAASLTKLVTALMVIENYKDTDRIVVDADAVSTEGTSGDLRSGEVYATEDLLKVMLLASSNDAAKAFANNLGKEKFILDMNNKAESLGMTHTLFHDSSGLYELNVTTADDIQKLSKYILENHPEIFNWSRLPSVLVQSTNDARSNTVLNINPFVVDQNFLGGKTGTSPEAKENLVALFTFHGRRVLVIILGSDNRVNEVNNLFRWAEIAFTFPN